MQVVLRQGLGVLFSLILVAAVGINQICTAQQPDLTYHIKHTILADSILRLSVDTAHRSIITVTFLKKDTSNPLYPSYQFKLQRMGYDLLVQATDTIQSPSSLPPHYLEIWPEHNLLMVSDEDGYEASFYSLKAKRWLAKQVRMPLLANRMHWFVNKAALWLVPNQMTNGMVYRLAYPYRNPEPVKFSLGPVASIGKVVGLKLLPSANKDSLPALLTTVKFGPNGGLVKRMKVQLWPRVKLLAVQDSLFIAYLRPLPMPFAFGDEHNYQQYAIGQANDTAILASSADQIIKWPLDELKDLSQNYRPDYFTYTQTGNTGYALAKSVRKLRRTSIGVWFGPAYQLVEPTLVVDGPSWIHTPLLDWPAPHKLGRLNVFGGGSESVWYTISLQIKGQSADQTKSIKPAVEADKWTKKASITEFWDLGRDQFLVMRDLKRYIRTGQGLSLTQHFYLSVAEVK